MNFWFSLWAKIKALKVKSAHIAQDEALRHNDLQNVDRLNKSADHWNRCRASDAKFLLAAYEQMISLSRLKNAIYAADYGCGTGVLVSLIKRDFPNVEIKGYDFSSEKIERCKEYYSQISECFSVGSVYSKLEPTCDVIFCTEVLEHLENPEDALKNMISGLRGNGRLLATVPNGRIDTYIGHVNFWSPESWKILIDKNIPPGSQSQTGMLENKLYALIVKEAN